MGKPMNKLVKYSLWAAGGFLGLVILLLVAAAILIPILLPPAKLKALATEKLTQNLHHIVTVSDVRFNVLSGFEIKNLKIANRPGWTDQPMVSAKDISISYHLLPLLWGQVSLGEVLLKQPDILIERRGLNQFNFSDMGGTVQVQPQASPKPKTKAKTKHKGKSKRKKSKRRAALPEGKGPEAFQSFFADSAWAAAPSKVDPKSPGGDLSLSVGSFKILHGRLTYLDRSASPDQKYLLSDLNLGVQNISMEGGKSTFTLNTPLEAAKLKYQLALGGAFRFFLAGDLVKDLTLEGTVNNEHGFKLAGDVAFADGLTPKLDGDASLDMLKFWDLIPRNLSQMPQGLSLTGPAHVDFHLGGSSKSNLELSGTADGTGLAVEYKDLFLKTNKTNCKVDFKSLVSMDGSYDLPSFKLVYQDWEVTGTFHHKNNAPWSCEVHSKSLPLKGLPGMIPKFRQTTVEGSGSLDLTIKEAKGNGLPFVTNGQVALKGVGITLPQESYLQSMNGVLYCANNVLRAPSVSFKCFNGTGAAGLTLNGGAETYSYALRLVNVDAQKAVNGSIDAYVSKKDFTTFKDTLYGTLNLAYAGSGKGFSGDPMLYSQLGKGGYNLVQAKVKGLTAIKAINSLMADKSDEIKFQKIEGTLGMKSAVFSYTANTSDKVGTMKIVGGVNSDGVYTPDMRIQCDIQKKFLDSDQVQNLLKDKLKDSAKIENTNKWIDLASDDQGNFPLDFRFTGKASKTPGLDCLDLSRAVNNVLRHMAKSAVQDLGSKLKDLFNKH